jgi:hypothetical protein
MQVSVLTAAPGPGQMAEARAVYAAAFGQAPYHEDDQEVTAFSERVLRYAAERQGFRFVWTLLTDAFRTADGQPGYWLMARDL